MRVRVVRKQDGVHTWYEVQEKGWLYWWRIDGIARYMDEGLAIERAKQVARSNIPDAVVYDSGEGLRGNGGYTPYGGYQPRAR